MKLKRRKGNRTNFRLFLLAGAIVAFIGSPFIQTNYFNELAIVSAIGVNWKDGKYVVTVQEFNPRANTKEGSAELVDYVFTQTGDSIPQAMRKISRYLARHLFVQNAQIIVISEQLAKSKGFLHLMHYTLRDPNFPTPIKMIISKGTPPEELLQILTPIIKISGIRLEGMLKNAESSWGEMQEAAPKTVTTAMLRHTKELTIPYVVVKGKVDKGITKENIERAQSKATVSLEGVGVFQHNRFSYYLSPDDTQILSLLTSKSKDSIFVTHCPNSIGTINWGNESSTPRIRIIKKSGVPQMEMAVKIRASLQDVSCKGNVSDSSTLQEFEHLIEQDMEMRFNEFIKSSQKHNADVIGFSDVIYRTAPNVWKSVKPKWKTLYPQLSIQTHVDVKLTEVGDMLHIPR